LLKVRNQILINPFILNNYRDKCKMLIGYVHVKYKKKHTHTHIMDWNKRQ